MEGRGTKEEAPVTSCVLNVDPSLDVGLRGPRAKLSLTRACYCN